MLVAGVDVVVVVAALLLERWALEWCPCDFIIIPLDGRPLCVRHTQVVRRVCLCVYIYPRRAEVGIVQSPDLVRCPAAPSRSLVIG